VLGQVSQYVTEALLDVGELEGGALHQAVPHLSAEGLAQVAGGAAHAAGAAVHRAAVARQAQQVPQQGQGLLLHQLGPARVQRRHQLWSGGEDRGGDGQRTQGETEEEEDETEEETEEEEGTEKTEEETEEEEEETGGGGGDRRR